MALFFMPPANFSCRRHIVFTLSVSPSVRQSVSPSVRQSRWFPCDISSKYEWISTKLHQWLHSRNPKVKFGHGRNPRILISSVASDWLIGFRAISQVNMNGFQRNFISGFIAGIRRSYVRSWVKSVHTN